MGGKKKKYKKEGNQTKYSDFVPTVEDNQIRPVDSIPSIEKFLPDNEQGSLCELNHHGGVPSNADSQSIGVSESDFEQERCRNLEAKCGELQTELRKFEEEKNMWSQKEGILEEKIFTLQNKVDSCIQRETKLEEKIDVLQNSNASLALQEAILEERVGKIERVESWQLEEGSIKEVVSKLGESNRVLEIQVKELRESRDGLAQKNEQFMENISILASRLEHLERVAFDAALKTQEENLLVDATNGIVEQDEKKEVSLEKVSKMHIEPFQQAIGDENPTSELGEKINGLSTINGVNDFGSLEQLQQIQLLGLDDSRISEDVVSVPLDDIIQVVHPPKEYMEAEHGVPLSDAPLIGAPFRLISFVARYVSGADLVDHDKPKVRH